MFTAVKHAACLSTLSLVLGVAPSQSGRALADEVKAAATVAAGSTLGVPPPVTAVIAAGQTFTGPNSVFNNPCGTVCAQVNREIVKPLDKVIVKPVATAVVRPVVRVVTAPVRAVSHLFRHH